MSALKTSHSTYRSLSALIDNVKKNMTDHTKPDKISCIALVNQIAAGEL